MTVPTPFMLADNGTGRMLAVRMLLPGSRYGRDNALTVPDRGEGPLVEFYDTLHACDGDDGQTGPLGRFLLRAYAADVAVTAASGGRLPLGGGPDGEWRFTADAMAVVGEWITTLMRVYSIHKTSGALPRHLARASAQAQTRAARALAAAKTPTQ